MAVEKKWTKAEVAFKLETNDQWLFRGLTAIYARQTADERNDGVTKHENGVGFSGVDSSFLSNAAKFYQDAGFLTAKHKASVRKAMGKYAGQLAKIANGY